MVAGFAVKADCVKPRLAIGLKSPNWLDLAAVFCVNHDGFTGETKGRRTDYVSFSQPPRITRRTNDSGVAQFAQ